jgi:hypothetical protein
VTAGSIFGAIAMTSDEFAQAPLLPSPGSIVVESSGPSSQQGGPVSVSVDAFGTTDQPRTRLNIAVTLMPSAGGVKDTSGHAFLVFLCGRIARDPEFVDNQQHAVAWLHPDLHAGESVNTLIGDMSDCVYSQVVLQSPGSVFRSLASDTGYRQVVLLGSSGPPPISVSGSKVLYSLPGVVSLPAGLFLGVPPVVSLPSGSTASVSLYEAPADFRVSVASPQLPDSGRLQWKADFGSLSLPATEYRLSGTFLDRESSGQHRLFLAGALIGIAGGTFVWLLERLVDIATQPRGGGRGQLRTTTPPDPTWPPNTPQAPSRPSGRKAFLRIVAPGTLRPRIDSPRAPSALVRHTRTRPRHKS